MLTSIYRKSGISISIRELLGDFITVPDEQNFEIAGICQDSRTIEPMQLFFAFGKGLSFIEQVIAKGVQGIVVDGRETKIECVHGVPIFSVPQLRQKLPLIARRFYQTPFHEMNLIGVTGTNGKTSITHYIAQLFHHFNLSCGLLGTLGCGVWPELTPPTHTTPEVFSLHEYGYEFWKQGVKHIAMEASSHALVQERVEGLPFQVGVFTNLTQDHLDYHGNMQAYFEAKKRLFLTPELKHAVIHFGCPYGRRLLMESRSDIHMVGYGLQIPPNNPSVDFVWCDSILCHRKGIQARVMTPWGEGVLKTNLLGRFNLQNVLAALSVLGSLGYDLPSILSGISELEGVAGRMQTMGGSLGLPHVVVDYAHTPDALSQVLQALKEHTNGQLWCVFGCGGNRDRTKRSMMAEMAQTFSDKIIVTDDNPRTEDPEQIVSDIGEGFLHLRNVRVIHDRALAIETALNEASSDDTVLIAGKGHEMYQQIGETRLPFQDTQVVKEVLSRLKKKAWLVD